MGDFDLDPQNYTEVVELVFYVLTEVLMVGVVEKSVLVLVLDQLDFMVWIIHSSLRIEAEDIEHFHHLHFPLIPVDITGLESDSLLFHQIECGEERDEVVSLEIGEVSLYILGVQKLNEALIKPLELFLNPMGLDEVWRENQLVELPLIFGYFRKLVRKVHYMRQSQGFISFHSIQLFRGKRNGTLEGGLVSFSQRMNIGVVCERFLQISEVRKDLHSSVGSEGFEQIHLIINEE